MEEEVKELAAIPSVVIVAGAAGGPKDGGAAAGASAGTPASVPALPAQPPAAVGVAAASPEAAPSAPSVEEKKAAAAALRRDEEDVVRVLILVGYGRREARERASKAMGLLSDLGRRPTGNEILNTAIHGRKVVYGVTDSACAESRPRDDCREGCPPPEAGEKGAGPQGGDRFGSSVS